MTVQEFIEAYDRAPQKDQFLKRHIKTDYVSYFLKIAECHKVVEFSMYKEVDGRKVFWKDSPSLFQLFICRLLAHYTDVDLGNDSANGFDELNKVGLINAIIDQIPESEYKEWNTLLQMIADDEMENVRSFAGYLDTKIDGINMLMKATAEDEELQKKIVEFTNQEG